MSFYGGYMSNKSVVRVKNFQADYDFRICSLSVSTYCIGNGDLVLDVLNKQTKEVVFENLPIKDGTQDVQCNLDNGIYNFKIYEVFGGESETERYLLYETNFTYSNPYDPKEGELIVKNIKYKGDEYALRYYYKITDIVEDENDKSISYGKMTGYDKFDILRNVGEVCDVRITFFDSQEREIFLEFKDEDEEFVYFLFHRDKRMLLKEEEKIDQINYEKYFELMIEDSSYLTTNYK